MALLLLMVVLVATCAYDIVSTRQTGQTDDSADLITDMNRGAAQPLIAGLRSVDFDGPLHGEQSARLAALVQSTFAADPAANVRLWAQDGTILYAHEPTWHVDKTRAEAANALITTYTPVQFAGESQPQGLLEIEQSVVSTPLFTGGLKEDGADPRHGLRNWVVLGGMLLYGGLAVLVWRARQTIRSLRRRLDTTSSYLQTSNALLREVHEYGRLHNPVE